MLFFVKCSSSYVIKSTIHSNNEWYICKLLTNYVLKRILPKGVSADKYFELCDFFREHIDVPYIHVYVWFKDDKDAIWMWIWLILKNINLLDRIWSLWLVCFAYSPTHFIFWLNRLTFSVSINSHSDNIYLSKHVIIYIAIMDILG
jgi:hypothetical protein